MLHSAVEAEFSWLRRLAAGCAIEWETITAKHNNVLLQGPQRATTRTIELLQPYLMEPLIWRRPGKLLKLIPHRPRTLILEDITALTSAEQTRLRGWLDDLESLQIVSTTDRPVFPLVGQGLFDEALYYRLNVMLLHVEESPATLPHAREDFRQDVDARRSPGSTLWS